MNHDSWTEPFADARDLMAESSSFAGRIPAVLVIVERFDEALRDASIAAEQRGDAALDELVAELREVQRALRARLAEAWNVPDDGVRHTRWALQLRTVEMFVFDPKVQGSLSFLEGLIDGSLAYARSDRSSLVRALECLVRGHEQARAQLERMTAPPGPSPEDDALAPRLHESFREVARMGAAVAAGNELLAGRR